MRLCFRSHATFVPADEVFRYLNSKNVREILVQALLDAPMFPIRCVGTPLAPLLSRETARPEMPAPLQANGIGESSGGGVPDQLACLENIAGDREIPDHPLVRQPIEDCLTEAWTSSLGGSVAANRSRQVECIARDLPEPSPLAHEILNARPYAFLDNAPLKRDGPERC